MALIGTMNFFAVLDAIPLPNISFCMILFADHIRAKKASAVQFVQTVQFIQLNEQKLIIHI